MSSNNQDQKPTDGVASGGPLKAMFTGVIYFFAFLAAIVVKPAQALTKEAYEESASSGFAFGIGILLSIVGSIGTGYLGWQHDVAIQWWLASAVATPLAIFYYLWPIAFLAVGKWAFKFSSFLWERVPDVNNRYNNGSNWLSILLAGLTQAGIVAGGLYIFSSVASHIHDFLDWGNFGWVVGAIPGAIIGWLIAMLATSALWSEGVLVVAVLSGAALTFFFGIDLSAHVPTFGYPGAVRHAGEGLQVLAWVAYVFPLLHIIISRMLGWVGKYLTKLLDQTYGDQDTNYVGFLGQVSTIAATALAGYHAFTFAHTFGFGLSLAAPATAVAVLAAYLVAGALLNRWSNVFVGVVSSLAAGFFAFEYGQALLPFGLFGGIAAGLVSALANFYLIYPLIYQGVKMVANPFIASWLGKPLTEMYKTISSEVFSSVEKTYDDTTPYAPLFVHAANIGFAFAVYVLAGELVPIIHLTGAMAIALPGLLTVASYLFVGRLLVAYKTPLIGALAAIGAGAFVGVEVFAHYDHNLWYAVPSFIAAALAFGFAVFPVSYVVVRAPLEAVSASTWARPIVEGLYNFFFSFIQAFWNEFVAVYRRISLSFAPIWANVSRTFDEAWTSAMEIFAKVFNGHNKK